MYTKGGVPMLQRAYVEITNICNLRCDFCPGTRRPLRAMRVSEFERIARELRPYTRHIYLHVMGEPLLHPELDKILDICRALDFRVHLTTNGVLLPDRLDLLLAAPALYRVNISLHSYEANHVQQTLESYVRDCCRCAAALAARRLEGEDRSVTCVLRLWNRGGGDTLNDRIAAVLEDCTGRPLHQLERDARGNRRLLPHVYIEEADRFHWPGDPAYDGPDAQFCYGLRRQAAVLCDGTVVPCCLDGEGRLPLGDLLHQSMEDILQGSRAQRIIRGFDCRRPAEELCRRCGYAARFNK